MATQRAQRAGLGVSPHSGWAALVALGGDPRRPAVLLRQRVEMTARGLPGPKQPYHDVEELPVARAEALLERWLASATSLAADSLRAASGALEKQGFEVAGLAILQSNGRQGASLEAILASHALIHTADGDHFRDALAEGARRCGVAATRLRQKELHERAAAKLGRPLAELQSYVGGLGKSVGPPWTSDQKSAALLAWLTLAG
jgi:hypothetical protein